MYIHLSLLEIPKQNSTFGCRKQQSLLSSPGGWEVKTKVASGLVSAVASRCRLLALAPWPCPSRVSLCVLISCCKDTGQIRLGFSLIASFQFNHCCKSTISKYIQILRWYTLQIQHTVFETQFIP